MRVLEFIGCGWLWHHRGKRVHRAGVLAYECIICGHLDNSPLFLTGIDPYVSRSHPLSKG